MSVRLFQFIGDQLAVHSCLPEAAHLAADMAVVHVHAQRGFLNDGLSVERHLEHQLPMRVDGHFHPCRRLSLYALP